MDLQLVDREVAEAPGRRQTIDGWRDVRPVGARVWFEYHCEEAHTSPHAQWWYHSHRQAVIVRLYTEAADDPPPKRWGQARRFREGWQLLYLVRFDDGFEADVFVFEDEILDGPDEFERPAPPPPAPSEAIAE